VTVTPEDFLRAVAMEAEPVVITSTAFHFWSGEPKKFRYLSLVRGFAFFCESPHPLELPETAIPIDTPKLTVPADL
jgi:hypothetical protein